MKTISLSELKQVDDTLRKAGLQVIQNVRVRLGAIQNVATTDGTTTKPVQDKSESKATAKKAIPTTSGTEQNTGSRQ